jgi:hypothetical protein
MSVIEDKEPIVRILAKIGSIFLSELHSKLKHLDIARSHYTSLLLEVANGRLTHQELAQKLSCDKVQVVQIIGYLSYMRYEVREEMQTIRESITLISSKNQNCSARY